MDRRTTSGDLLVRLRRLAYHCFNCTAWTKTMAARFFEQEHRSGSDGLTTKRVALVVGNGAYPHARLPNAVNDARLIAAALESIGFGTEVLLDTGRAALETAIVRLGERMERAGP